MVQNYVYVLMLKEIVFVTAQICLKWNLSVKSLELRCTVDRIESRMAFFDPDGHEQGYCLMPYPVPFCISNYKNGTINQHLTTNEAILTISGKHYNHAKGKWTCQHGKNFAIAIVDVKGKNETGPDALLDVILTGPQYVQANNPVLLTCYATGSPEVQTVEFFVNEILYSRLTNENGRCHSSLHNTTCTTGDCQCTETGKKYMIKYTNNIQGKVTIRCEMAFSDTGKKTDCLFVQIYDIQGPNVQLTRDFETTELTCTAYGNVENVILRWNCSHISQPAVEIKNTTAVKSTVSFRKPHSFENIVCLCTAETNYFQRLTRFVYENYKPPPLELESLHVCNSSSTISLVCSAIEDNLDISFEPWMHSYKNVVIRYLPGIVIGNLSMLHIKNCSFEDVGDYMCRAYIDVHDTVLRTNASSNVIVKGSPIIVDQFTKTKPNVKLVVHLYAMPKPEDPKWFLFLTEVSNSEKYNLTFSNQTLLFVMHGTPVVSYGYKASLSIGNNEENNAGSIYSVLLKNTYGNITQEFLLNTSGRQVYNLQDTVWIISSVLLFLITVVSVTLIFRCRNTDSRDQQRNAREVYFAVVPTETYVQIYDGATSHYEEISNTRNTDQQQAVSEENSYEEIDKL